MPAGPHIASAHSPANELILWTLSRQELVQVIWRSCVSRVNFSSLKIGLNLTLSPGQKPLHIFAEQIRLQINGSADLGFAQPRHVKRVRNDPDAKTFFLHGGDGETDAVHRDRAFENEITHHVRWRGNVENVIFAGALDRK